MCDALATTKEHIPPKALFPKQKDVLSEISLRKDLITVPSCEKHNNSKSRDDEYLVFCLSTCFHGNDIKWVEYGEMRWNLAEFHRNGSSESLK